MRDPGNYQPRFVDAGGEHEHTNRLAAETSPYLLQHAHNPVDWYPWGPKAFAAAREQDKPIFLSIGYSTCYWCHVMERESFENEAVAALMNEFFICIKVDREERPDVDDLYMTAVQLFNNGSGGWPMSVFLEPVTLKPFYAGTYFPPDDMRGRPGFSTLLRRVSELWSGGRDQLLEQADKAAASISADLQSSAAPVALDLALIDDATTRLLASWDQQLGGFGAAPKFPQPDRLLFLQQVAASDAQASKAVHHT
ncbi:thioredoxin domain-containing protein, partial [bacterium]